MPTLAYQRKRVNTHGRDLSPARWTRGDMAAARELLHRSDLIGVTTTESEYVVECAAAHAQARGDRT